MGTRLNFLYAIRDRLNTNRESVGRLPGRFVRV